MEFNDERFNSIKVRLKEGSKLTGEVSLEFQFHKGTIKRPLPTVRNPESIWFQFHKGTIKRGNSDAA